MNYLDTFIFGIYPYICLAVFFVGSLIRYDRDQYTWKSDSSQLLRKKQLRIGSIFFHIGVLFLFFGHGNLLKCAHQGKLLPRILLLHGRCGDFDHADGRADDQQRHLLQVCTIFSAGNAKNAAQLAKAGRASRLESKKEFIRVHKKGF